MKCVRKELQELDLIDNFLFGSVLTHPVYGPRIGRMLLEKMLQRNLGELIVTPQKIYFGSDIHLHGIRLDVHLEEKLDATTVYDVEPPDMPYEDGALTLFFYTKGEVGIPSEEIKQLLMYMEDSSKENVTNEFLREIHGMVDHVKHDEEVSIRYMRLWREEEDIREEGRQIGIEEGIEKGIEKGLHKGIAAFILDNMEENVPKNRIIEKLVKRFEMSRDEAEVCYNKYSV